MYLPSTKIPIDVRACLHGKDEYSTVMHIDFESNVLLEFIEPNESTFCQGVKGGVLIGLKPERAEIIQSIMVELEDALYGIKKTRKQSYFPLSSEKVPINVHSYINRRGKRTFNYFLFFKSPILGEIVRPGQKTFSAGKNDGIFVAMKKSMIGRAEQFLNNIKDLIDTSEFANATDNVEHILKIHGGSASFTEILDETPRKLFENIEDPEDFLICVLHSDPRFKMIGEDGWCLKDLPNSLVLEYYIDRYISTKDYSTAMTIIERIPDENKSDRVKKYAKLCEWNL
ncbi:MAG: hypothetical protein ACE5R6_16675 [Candidatus Heimdallarchaeota archaeon]